MSCALGGIVRISPSICDDNLGCQYHTFFFIFVEQNVDSRFNTRITKMKMFMRQYD
jgi:hypothetical protein